MNYKERENLKVGDYCALTNYHGTFSEITSTRIYKVIKVTKTQITIETPSGQFTNRIMKATGKVVGEPRRWSEPSLVTYEEAQNITTRNRKVRERHELENAISEVDWKRVDLEELRAAVYRFAVGIKEEAHG